MRLRQALVLCATMMLFSQVSGAVPFYPDMPNTADRSICGSDDNMLMAEQSIAMNALGRPVGSLHYDRPNTRGFMCTGTLVGPDLFLTARHCKEACEGMSVKFGFLGRDAREEVFKCAEIVEAGDFQSMHDYMLIRLDGKPGVEWGWIPLSDKQVEPEAQLLLVHHPRGKPMQVSLKDCVMKGETEGLLHHTCDSEPGSSGSGILLPDFENPDETRIVGVHAFGGCGSFTADTNSGPSIHQLATKSDLIRSLVKD